MARIPNWELKTELKAGAKPLYYTYHADSSLIAQSLSQGLQLAIFPGDRVVVLVLAAIGQLSLAAGRISSCLGFPADPFGLRNRQSFCSTPDRGTPRTAAHSLAGGRFGQAP